MKATAKARRSGEWWAVDVEVNGEEYHSQAKRLDQVPEMAADLVALLMGQPAGSVEVTVVPILPDTEAAAVRVAVESARTAEAAARDAGRLSREAVALLRSEGLTVRDVGTLLGVSAQRVSQLANH